MKTPVLPVSNPHPDGSVWSNNLGFHSNSVPLDLPHANAAFDVRANGRTFAVDLQLFHSERKNDVALGEKIEPPATK